MPHKDLVTSQLQVSVFSNEFKALLREIQQQIYVSTLP